MATATTYAFTATTDSTTAVVRAVFTNTTVKWRTTAASLTVRSVSGSDFDGDAVTDLAVYRRTTGVWYVGNMLRSVRRPGRHPGSGGLQRRRDDRLAVYRPSTGFWYVRQLRPSSGAGRHPGAG